MSLSIIAERQAATQRRYLRLASWYADQPFASRHTYDAVEDELTCLECEMLDMPPLYREDYHRLEPWGAWRVRGKGLVPHDVMIESGELPKLEAMSFKEAGLKVIPVQEWSDIIEDLNRTPPAEYCPFTLDQRSVGSCGAEGSVGALMERRVADGQKHVLLNPYDPYHTTSGGVDRGSSPRDNMSFLQKYGCASQAVWPRSKGWRQKPSDEARQDALQYRLMPDGLVWVTNWEEAGTCLLKGFSLPFGYSGHWIFGVDVVSTTRFKYKNSWGRSWGDNGFGTIHKNSIYWPYRVCAIISVGDRRAA